MPPRPAVEKLEPEQFDFVIRALLSGCTDRELSRAFEKQFEGKKLAKSSIARWRAAAGSELKDRFRIARYQAQQLKEQLKQEGVPGYDVMMADIEDRLLVATRDLINADPVRVLKIRQDEEKNKLKKAELELRAEDLKLRREKQERDAALKADKFGVALEFWRFLLAELMKRAPAAADAMTKHSTELLEGFAKQIEA